jgi:arginase
MVSPGRTVQIDCRMDIHLIVVPYDSARRGYRMGAGPEHLIRSGLPGQLTEAGHMVTATTVESSEHDAAQSSFDLARQLAGHVGAAEQRSAFPIVLAGNCIATLGGFAGLESRTAIMWMDAHADFNTPETSPSGFVDGMTLAIMTGRCLEDQSGTIGGFDRLNDADLVMVSVRSIDEGEKAALARVHLASDAESVTKALGEVRNPELYIHIDLDCIDPSVMTANEFATPNGLSRESLLACVEAAARMKHVCALAVTAYDPATDQNNAGPALVMDIISSLVALVPSNE